MDALPQEAEAQNLPGDGFY